MVTTDDRRWLLRGFNAANDLIYEITCTGDRELQAAIVDLERRPDLVRHSTRRAPLLGERPTFTQDPPLFDASTDDDPTAHIVPGRTCAECDLTERECVRRARINGHDFTPRGPALGQPQPTEGALL